MTPRLIGFVSAILLMGVTAQAQLLYATSYSAPVGEGVSQGLAFNLLDETGFQLQDNQLGGNDWRADLGQGPAFEWVGWRFAEPAIDFHFAQVERIGSIRLGFARNETGRVYVPPVVIINWVFYAIPAGAIPPNSRGFVTLNGPWTTDLMRVQLVDGNNQRAVLLDEVQFVAVPETGTAWPLGLAVLFLRRRVS